MRYLLPLRRFKVLQCCRIVSPPVRSHVITGSGVNVHTTSTDLLRTELCRKSTLSNEWFLIRKMSTNISGELGRKPYIVDMRSDTETKLTPAVRQAISLATDDDDVYREDQTVFRLEREMAELFGKEAALFVVSGTMVNLLAMSCHCPTRGLEIIMGDKSHTMLWEQGGISQFSGLHVRTIPNLPDGTFDLQALEDSIRPTDDSHEPRTGLICVENTHNFCGGKVIPAEFFAKVKVIADAHGLPVHLDGSRLLNAAVALKVTPKSLAEHVDSLNFCLSKGVGAPVGSVLVGSKDLIERALRMRKALGGGWRKPGILAAAALEAMKGVEARLNKDHQHAVMYAKGVMADQYGVVNIDIAGIQSNMIVVDILKAGITAVAMCERLARVTEQEYSDMKMSVVLKAAELTKYAIRFVTLSDLSEEDIKLAVAKTCYVLKEYSLN